MRIFLIHLILMALAIATTSCSSAPLPATSSSGVIDPANGTFRSVLKKGIGFQLSSAKTGWQLIDPPQKSQFVRTMYRAPQAYDDIYASLSVRVDDMGKEQSLETYVNRWLTQYPKFGFEVLGKKKFNHNDTLGFVIDLLNRKAARQLRQVVYVHQRHAVVMTCKDHSDNFRNSLPACNQIVRSFTWNQE